MNILMTGAFGIVGTAIRDHLADRNEYEFTYLSYTNRPEHEMIAADVTDYDDIRAAFDGQDVVIDLVLPPGLSSEDRSIGWSDGYHANLQATANQMEAAVDAGVEKYIYASSNHVVGWYELANAPRIYEPGHGIKLDHTVPVRPDSMYGVTKAHGEAMGRLCADAHGLSTYVLRICSVREAEYDHPYSDAVRGGRPDTDEEPLDPGSQEYQERVGRMKAMWQSRRDCAQMVECCLQDHSVDYDVFYGVSDNDRRWMDIDHAREVIGYEPQDNAEEWTSPP